MRSADNKEAEAELRGNGWEILATVGFGIIALLGRYVFVNQTIMQIGMTGMCTIVFIVFCSMLLVIWRREQ